MTIIAAIDPGYEVSAYLEWDGKEISQYGIIKNTEVLEWIKHSTADYLFIEKVVCMGERKTGKEVLDTVFWCGRFYQVWIDRNINLDVITDISDMMIPRTTIKKHFGVSNDSGMRKKLIERYGKQITKCCKSHLWQALALAAWVTETTFLENE